MRIRGRGTPGRVRRHTPTPAPPVRDGTRQTAHGTPAPDSVGTGTEGSLRHDVPGVGVVVVVVVDARVVVVVGLDAAPVVAVVVHVVLVEADVRAVPPPGVPPVAVGVGQVRDGALRRLGLVVRRPGHAVRPCARTRPPRWTAHPLRPGAWVGGSVRRESPVDIPRLRH